MTYTSHSEISQSILDLIFATSKIAENVIDRIINDEIVTRSDHDVISFNLLSKNASKVDSSLNATYKVFFFISSLSVCNLKDYDTVFNLQRTHSTNASIQPL